MKSIRYILLADGDLTVSDVSIESVSKVLIIDHERIATYLTDLVRLRMSS